MGKRISYLMVLVCAFVMMLASAQAGESYSYITVDMVAAGSTQTTTTDLTNKSNYVLNTYYDMQGSKSHHIIPGLSYTLTYNPKTSTFITAYERFVPQGMCIAGNYILISAYDSAEICKSVIYVLSKSTNKLITTIVLPDKAHVGGLAYDTGNGYIWVCNENAYVSGFSYKLLNNSVTGVNSSSSRRGVYLSSFEKEYKVKTQEADYCTYFDGKLWVGMFNSATVADIYAYEVNLSNSTLTAKYIMEAPTKTQGIAFYRNGSDVYLLVSQSYGRTTNSQIILYKPSYSSPQTVSGQSYTRIAKNNRLNDSTFSPMTEAIVISGTDVYILFESGAYYYHEPTEEQAADGERTMPFDQYLIYSITKFVNY